MVSKWATFLGPLILVTYPVTFFYAENTREAISAYEVGATLGVLLAATLILLLLFRPVTKDSTKGKMLFQCSLLLFCLQAHSGFPALDRRRNGRSRSVSGYRCGGIAVLRYLCASLPKQFWTVVADRFRHSFGLSYHQSWPRWI